MYYMCRPMNLMNLSEFQILSYGLALLKNNCVGKNYFIYYPPNKGMIINEYNLIFYYKFLPPKNVNFFYEINFSTSNKKVIYYSSESKIKCPQNL